MLISSRFASIYAYDPELFKRRFLGEDGVSRLSSCSVCGKCSYHWQGYRFTSTTWRTRDVSLIHLRVSPILILTYTPMLIYQWTDMQALMDFWNRNRDQDFFRQHPVLSHPDSCLKFIFYACSYTTFRDIVSYDMQVNICWNLIQS